MSAGVCRTCKARDWAVSTEEANLRRMALRAAKDDSPAHVSAVDAARAKLDKARAWRDEHAATCAEVA